MFDDNFKAISVVFLFLSGKFNNVKFTLLD